MLELITHIRLVFALLGSFLVSSSVLRLSIFSGQSNDDKRSIVIIIATIVLIVLCVFVGLCDFNAHFWFITALVLLLSLLLPFLLLYRLQWKGIAAFLAVITLFLSFFEKLCGVVKTLLTQ